MGTRIWVWIRVPLDSIRAAIGALFERADRRHAEASATHKSDPVKAIDLRREADEDHAHAKAVQKALRDEDGWPK